MAYYYNSSNNWWKSLIDLVEVWFIDYKLKFAHNKNYLFKIVSHITVCFYHAWWLASYEIKCEPWRFSWSLHDQMFCCSVKKPSFELYLCCGYPQMCLESWDIYLQLFTFNFIFKVCILLVVLQWRWCNKL